MFQISRYGWESPNFETFLPIFRAHGKFSQKKKKFLIKKNINQKKKKKKTRSPEGNLPNLKFN